VHEYTDKTFLSMFYVRNGAGPLSLLNLTVERSVHVRSRSHPHTFPERLAEQKARLEKKASQLKPGPERDDLLKKAQQIDTAAEINEWLNSPGRQASR
jgi:hypothetical protein